jgi:hypothetical protein
MRFTGSSVLLVLVLISAYAQAYSGGNGTETNPFQIAEAQDLIDLGNTPVDYNSFFVLTADIDLSGITFDQAVIAPDKNHSQHNPNSTDSTWFRGSLDGQGHVIRHLTVNGVRQLGLVGRLGEGGSISNLGIVDAEVTGSDGMCGTLAGMVNHGAVSNCFSTGKVIGQASVGGLVGTSYSYSVVRGSYSSASVSGNQAGGLVGHNTGSEIISCYCTGSVSGQRDVGGLLGLLAFGRILNSFSISHVTSQSSAGGLVGSNSDHMEILGSFWDVNRSGLTHSDGGIGMKSEQIRDVEALALNGFALDPNWVFDEGWDHPRLAWETDSGYTIPSVTIDWLNGSGTKEDPYEIETVEQLHKVGMSSQLWDKCFSLVSDLDFHPRRPGNQEYSNALIGCFSGEFDGNHHTIHNLHIRGRGYLGFFGLMLPGARVSDLGFENASVSGDHCYVGTLAGYCRESQVMNCYSNGGVAGTDRYIGGLVGYAMDSEIIRCYSLGIVYGGYYTGGLIGENSVGCISQCWSSADVNASEWLGGLVGMNASGGVIRDSFCLGSLNGWAGIGGIAGSRFYDTLINCFSASVIAGTSRLGGLAGEIEGDCTTIACFWNKDLSGHVLDEPSKGLTTAQMQARSTFVSAGWDFVDETRNGTDDIWFIPEGHYPRLVWQGPLPIEIQLASLEGLVATGNNGLILSVNGIERLHTGTTSFMGDPIWPIFSPDMADDLDLSTLTVTDGQTGVQTRFDVPVVSVVILTRERPDRSLIQLLGRSGDVLCEPVMLDPDSFSATQYTCMGKTVWGVVVHANAAFYGIALSPEYTYLMGIDIVSVLGIPDWASQGMLSPINGCEATGDDGEILSINGMPVEDLILGTTRYEIPWGGPIFPASGADDFDLLTLASMEHQSGFETIFDQIVTETYLIIRPYLGENVGMIELLDGQGEPLGEVVEFGPESFAGLGYSSYGQEIQGLKVSGEGVFRGVRVRMKGDNPLVLYPVSISATSASWPLK